jgi:BirA family biotin operon repressor/biotin-[acetyl-CoA-carboxylase] ligase
MSLILRPPPPLLPLSAAVAVCDVAGEEALIKWPNDIVLARSPAHAAAAGPRQAGAVGAFPRREALRKLAGILVEGRLQDGWVVLGIGINVAVREQDIPPGLSAATLGRSPEAIEPLLEQLLAALERRIAEPRRATLTGWRARDALLEREIIWEEPRASASAGVPGRAGGERQGGAGVLPAGSPFGRGRAEGIDGCGRLLVVLADGCQAALDSGEVHLVG